MGTSLGQVIDYLIDTFSNGVTVPAQPPYPGKTVAALTSIEPTVEVADYFPTTSNGTYVIVGRTDGEQTETADTTVEYGEIGAERVTEAYLLPGVVTVIRDGPRAAAARNPCLALFDGVVAIVHADPTCGGILQRGQIAYISRAVLEQADPSPKDGSVMASMQFWISVKNKYIP